MKKYILLFVITFCLFPLYAQKIPPKWIKYNEKHKEIQNEFQNKLNKEGAIADTLATKDSIIISYISKYTHKILQKYSIYIEDDCGKFESLDFYNIKEQIVYRKRWFNQCPRNENQLSVIYYERFEYDKKGRLITHVFEVSTPMTIKNIYGYKKGKRYIKKHTVISEIDFWK